MRISQHDLYLGMAKLVALRGTCSRRKVGCVLVDSRGRVLSTGYNGVASGLPHCNEGHPCPGAGLPSGQGLDSCQAIHAEQNAILHLADPYSVDVAYVTATPCISCMKLLLGTSCRLIVAAEAYPHSQAVDWWRAAGREILL
jgi:dCMP deaminase